MLPLVVTWLLVLGCLNRAWRGLLSRTVVATAVVEGISVCWVGRRTCAPVLDMGEEVCCRLTVYAWQRLLIPILKDRMH